MKRNIILLMLFFIFSVGQALAQDANYWQSNYGPGGLLTPGATLVNDNGRGFFYYNPALLAINPKNSVSLSANIYQYGRLKIKDGVGNGLDLKSSNFKINPQMVAGTIAFKKKKTFAFGYALMHNPVISYQTTQRQDKQMQVLDDSYSPGQEYYIGQFLAHNRVSHTSAIISAGVKLSKAFSVGLMAEGRIRSQDFFQDYTSRAMVNTLDSTTVFPEFANVESSYQLTYTQIGIRFKVGGSFESGRHHAGLLASMPMIHVWGRGDLSSDLVVSNLQLLPGTKINLLANGQQTGLHALYREPLSFAFGYAYDYGYGQLSLTGEYFLPLKLYNIITPRSESFIRPDTGSNRTYTTDLLKFVDERKSVINLGVGITYFINPDLTAFLSLRTDFSYAFSDNLDGFYPNVTNTNSYHTQIGGNFKRKKLNLRAGLLLTYGSSAQYLQPVNFSNPNEDNFMGGDLQKVRGNFFSVGFLLAYVHNL
jgi:hypothetical protein